MTHAKILNKTDRSICFQVDEVQRKKHLLPSWSLEKQLQAHLKTPLLECSHASSTHVIQAGLHHPLIRAVHAAYSNHFPLKITPDVFWLTVSQGFALHIQTHAETLRGFFVAHHGREKLTVYTSDLTSRKDWEQVVEAWCEHITTHVGQDTSALFRCDFSTSTPITQIASQIVMMAGLKEYFEYELMWVCGIPQVTLEGTLEDWKDIKKRVEQLAFYDLEWWTDHLLPICNALIETAAGRPPLEFWQDLYLPVESYGTQQIRGWLKCLFPYLENTITSGSEAQRNPCLDLPFQGFKSASILDPGSVPDGLSRVPFQLVQAEQSQELCLLGGCLGVQQSAEDHTLEPMVGWGVFAPPMIPL